MKKFLISLIFLCVNISLLAQNEKADLDTACLDTLLYRQLQLDKEIAPTTDLRLMSDYYMLLKRGYKKSPKMEQIRRAKRSMSWSYSSSDYNPETLRDMGNEEKSAPFYDGEYERLKYDGYLEMFDPMLAKFYDGDPTIDLNLRLHKQYNRQHGLDPAKTGNVKRYREKSEMKDLINRLEQFRARAKNLPIFFDEIEHKYQGDIRKYVKDLYRKSIMGNFSVQYAFARNPTMESIQSDLGVQFAVGLALYELWIKEIREKTGK